MSDEIRDENIRDRKEISTADLADVREEKSQTIEIESRRPLVTPAPKGDTPASGTTAGTATARAKTEEELGPLFSPEEASEFRARWDQVQVAFVDEPRQAVEDADHLVAATMKRLAEVFAQERQKLEQQWSRGSDVSTEDLRVALRRYRAFFGRLLRV
jgi:hypothetical protein